MLLLLFGTHLFLTWKTGLIQRKLPLAIRLSLTPDAAVGAETGNGDGGLSPFASLTTALASSLGVGNIVGMGTAVALGEHRGGVLVLDHRFLRDSNHLWGGAALS